MKQPFNEIQNRLLFKYIKIVGAVSLSGAILLYILNNVLKGFIVDFFRVLFIDADPFTIIRSFFSFALPLMIIVTSFMLVYFLVRDYMDVLKMFLDGVDAVYEQQRATLHVEKQYQTIADAIMDSATEYRQSELSAQEDEMKKKDLIYLLTQDIRLPLSSIIMYIELLQKEKQISPSTRRDFMQTILLKSMDLEDMINEFFDITRFNLRYSKWQSETFSLTFLVEQVIEEFAYLYEEKGMDIHFDYDDGATIRADNEKIYRVIRDLLRNICVIGYEGSMIKMVLKNDGDYYHLSMMVDAVHLNGESVANLFKNYYHLKEIKVNGRSHVLGLGIVKSIMEVAKGSLFASSIGETLKFDVYFERMK